MRIYLTADVININGSTENYEAIRASKFLAEHTHTEDEIRFLWTAKVLFWFNLEMVNLFSTCVARKETLFQFLRTKHWFDADVHAPFVKAIHFIDIMSGWVPHYTSSNWNSNLQV